MSSCNINHSIEDVKNKLTAQQPFLTNELYSLIERFLSQSPSQSELNEIFHLLKKYDLATELDKEKRNRTLISMLK
ncbi:hypothetical protein [Bacillus sp. AK128]